MACRAPDRQKNLHDIYREKTQKPFSIPEQARFGAAVSATLEDFQASGSHEQIEPTQVQN